MPRILTIKAWEAEGFSFLLGPAFLLEEVIWRCWGDNKKGSVFYADEVNELPLADSTTGIEVSGTTGSRISR